MTIEDFTVGEYVISLHHATTHRYENDILRVNKIEHRAIYYKSKRFKDGSDISSNDLGTWRKATGEEVAWHLKDPEKNLNLSNMPKEPVINNTYNLY